MLKNKKYIWLYRTTRFGRIINRWDKVSLDENNVKTCVLRHADEAVRASSIIEHVFPVKSSRLLDAYRADKGETFFVCVKKKNNSTAWEQFNSPCAAKKYISSMRIILKEIYIFSSKDMIMRA